jgi:hypothetical protein
VPIVRSSSLKLPALVALKKAKVQGARIKPEVLHARTIVRYFNLTLPSNSLQEKALADVPEKGRFYLITTGQRARYASSVKGAPSVDHSEVQRAVAAYQVLRAVGIPLEEISGAVVLPPRRLRELGLREGGWRNLFLAMIETIRTQPVAKALTEIVSVMPKMDFENPYVTEQAGLLGVLAGEAHERTQLWQAVEPVLKDYPQLNELLRDLIQANSGSNANRASAREALDTLLRQLPVTIPGFNLKPVKATGLVELLRKRYPLTAYLDSRTFRTHGNARPQQAVRYLQKILDGPRRKRTKLLRPSLEQLSLPIAD